MLFVGAGLSVWAKLPTWQKLLETLVAEVRAEGAETDAEELQKLLNANKYLEVADCCKERLGQRFYEVLRPLRGGDGPVPEPHRLALRLPFAAWVTTNYDMLLELAYVAEHGGLPRVLTHKDHASLGTLLFDGAPFILKAHGDIDRPDTVVLTARDYSALIQGNQPFNALFSALLLTKAVLFLGYSLSDPDFRLLLDRQLALFGDQVPDRWALMSGVGPVERDLLWRTARIKVLSYPAGKHEEVLAFLHAIESALNPIPAVRSTAEDRTFTRLPGKTSLDEPDPGPPSPPQGLGYGNAEWTSFDEPDPGPPPGPPNKMAGVWFEPAPPQLLSQNALTLALNRGRSGIAAVLGRAGDPPLARDEGGPVDRAALTRVLATLGTLEPAARDYAESGRALAACLPGSVIEVLAKLDGDELLVLQLDPDLENLPWELLPIDGRPLALLRPLVRGPVGISEEARGYRPLRRPARALLIGDPTEAEPEACEEIERVEALYRDERAADSTRLLGRQATAAAVLAALDGADYDVVHFAGYAWYDAQEVYLVFADHVQVTASDLRPALSRHPPAILILNSNFTAFVPPGVGMERPDAVPLPPTPVGRPGFTALAARTGVGALVGCFASPGNFAAVRMGIHLHRELLGGATIAQALYRARLALAQEAPEDPTGLGYVLSGASELRMLPG